MRLGTNSSLDSADAVADLLGAGSKNEEVTVHLMTGSREVVKVLKRDRTTIGQLQAQKGASLMLVLSWIASQLTRSLCRHGAGLCVQKPTRIHSLNPGADTGH